MTRLPNTNHQRFSQQVPYCREVPGCPLLTTGLSAAVYPSRMHIANISREVQDSSNFLYFATRSHPFSAFFPPRSTESGMFSVLRAHTPVESPRFLITTKTTSATSHQHLHIVFASISQHFPTSRTTWRCPHLPRDSRQSISRHFSVTKTTWQHPHRLRDTKQSVLPHFPTPKTTSATPHLPRGSKGSSRITGIYTQFAQIYVRHMSLAVAPSGILYANGHVRNCTKKPDRNSAGLNMISNSLNYYRNRRT